MKNEITNKIHSKNEFQTPKIINKKQSLRKTKSSSNIISKNSESLSLSKIPLSARTHIKQKSNYVKNKIETNPNYSNNDKINEKKIFKRLIPINRNKNSFKISKKENDKIIKNKNSINKEDKKCDKKEKKIVEKINKVNNKLNIIPLPIKRISGSPPSSHKFMSRNCNYSPKGVNKHIMNNSSYNNKIIRNDIKYGKEIIKKDNLNNSKKNLNKSMHSSSSKKIEFLYLPHIVLDPLDVLKNQIEIILQKYEDKIILLNKSNIEENIHTLIINAHKNYANNLYEIYQEKEKELFKAKNNYNIEIYNMMYNENNNKMEIINKKRDNQIEIIENNFKEKKDKLKNEFRNKIEEIKKSDYFMKQVELNKKMIIEMKNKFLKIFNDKNIINKKGINFTMNDYKKRIKYKNASVDKLRNTSY